MSRISFHSSRIAGCTVLILASSPGFLLAGVAYNESVNGDFSNSGSTPTSVTLAPGENEILGTTGRGAAGTDRDYFTVTVPVGWELSSLTVLTGTTVGGATSFLGLEAGPKLTLPTNPANANGLLGWWHYGPGDINHDILASMATSADGSSGFTPPLGPGAYSFWVQDFNSGSFNYHFDITLKSTPETGPGLAMNVALIGLLAVAQRTKLRMIDFKGHSV